jgi:hypothetical protein
MSDLAELELINNVWKMDGKDIPENLIRSGKISSQPHESWTLDENFIWQSPVEYPEDGKAYNWNEETLQWTEIPDSERA